jgi:hypothetical protein
MIDKMMLNNELERTWSKTTKVLLQHWPTETEANYEHIEPKSECSMSDHLPGTMQKHYSLNQIVISQVFTVV